MALDLESLIGKIVQMAEASQKARGYDNFGSEGARYNMERAYTDSRNDVRDKSIFERDKQRDFVSNARDERDKDMTLANMQNIREEGINQRYLDAARIRRGDPLNPEGEFTGNSLAGGYGGGGGSRASGSRAGKEAMSPGQIQYENWAKDTSGRKPEEHRAAWERFNTPAPSGDGYHIDPAAPPPQRFKIGDQGQAVPLSVQGNQQPASTLSSMSNPAPSVQGIQTPRGSAPTSMTPAQWQAYADSLSGSTRRTGGRQGMQFQGVAPGIAGDQIAEFKRQDGSRFFANTGAAQMQTGGAGISGPGPNLEGMRSMRSGQGPAIPPIARAPQMQPAHTPQVQPVGGFWDALGQGSVSALDALGGKLSSARQNFNPSNFSASNTIQDLAGIPRGESMPQVDIPGFLERYNAISSRNIKKYPKKKSWFDVPDSSTNPLLPNYRQ